jgi:LPS export ABC transporter protein LptC
MRSAILLLLVCLIPIAACGSNRSRSAETLSQGSNDVQKFDNSLKFSNVTLEQADEKGKLWWKVKAAQATYSKDQKIAAVDHPEGELYQDGFAVFKIAGTKGEVIQDGKSIVLRGDITATDLKDGTILQGQEIEWKPSEDKLFVRKKFIGNHKQMRISGDEGQFITRLREAEIKGNVIADIQQTPPTAQPSMIYGPPAPVAPAIDPKAPRMRMQTTLLKWQIGNQLVTADQPLKIDRVINEQVTDRASAGKGSYSMKTAMATLNQDAQVFVQAQNTQLKSNELVWDTKQQFVNANQPVTIVSESQKITMNADRGKLNIPAQNAVLTGHVKGLSLQNQATVGADNLTWFFNKQSFEATGNILYQQTTPPFTLAGTKAVGTLQDQQVEISGGPEGDNRVVTEIVPNLLRR